MRANNERKNQYYFYDEWKYNLFEWNKFDYDILKKLPIRYKTGASSNISYNNVIIMADTETSKSGVNEYEYQIKNERAIKHYTPIYNYVVAFTISIRAYGTNICTLYGHDPDEFIQCLSAIQRNLRGKETYIYFHNLSYDWVFIRKFMFREFGHPVKQLNTKSHYPIYIEFENGIRLRDSLIVAQRSLDKWAKDFDVPHQKAVGLWEYGKIRSQKEVFTPEELKYIEHDTLAGVECLNAQMIALNKTVSSMYITATGVPRDMAYKRGKKDRAKEHFLRQALTYEQQLKIEKCYHGGYTHGNRHFVEVVMNQETIKEYFPKARDTVVKCCDFASSYPYVLLSEKYPMETFAEWKDCDVDEILADSDQYAFIFKLRMYKGKLKDDFLPMPPLQYSKLVESIDVVEENGRVLAFGYVEIYLTEIDLQVINEYYEAEYMKCVEVERAYKKYLPRWFTDYIFECFENKTRLKGGDAVQYAISKSIINSLYGMCVQRPLRNDITEDYDTGLYESHDKDTREDYQAYLNDKKKILNYAWGVYCTAYAYRNLFELGKCFDTGDYGAWLYSDTDSAYGIGLNFDKVDAYNEKCKEKLKANGYGCVIHNNREYWLGLAEHEPSDRYTEFIYCGAKRYCGRQEMDGELHLTTAGVPKSAVKCLDDKIENYQTGFVFHGEDTGKLTHFYIYEDDIHTDSNGNIYGDSVDLVPCDYLLSSVQVPDWEYIFNEEILIQTYE